MKKRISAIIFALAVLISAAIPASAASHLHIIDDVAVLSAEEEAELEQEAQRIENLYGYHAMICFNDEFTAENAKQYADREYNDNSHEKNGIVLAVNTKSDIYNFYCYGNAENVFTADELNQIWDAYTGTKSFFESAEVFYRNVEAAIENDGIVTAENVPVNEADGDFEYVERTLPLVVDYADLLTDDEEKAVSARLETISSQYEMEAAVVTEKNLDGKTPAAYADDFFDYNGYGFGEEKDGLLILFKTGADGDRNLYISTHGKGQEWFDSETVNDILYSLKPFLVEEDYLGAFMLYTDLCEKYMEEGSKGDSVSPIFIPVALAVGFLLAFIIMKIISSPAKSVHMQESAENYVRNGSLIVTGSADTFLYNHVTRSAKPKDSGSDSHTSSSGESHGGGGISF